MSYQFNHAGEFLGGSSTYRESGVFTLSMKRFAVPVPGVPAPFTFEDDGTSTYDIDAQEVYVLPPDDRGCVATTTTTLQKTGNFTRDGTANIGVDASDPSDATRQGAVAKVSIQLVLRDRSVTTYDSPACGPPPEPSEGTALIPFNLQCVPPPIPAGVIGPGPQLIGVRRTVDGTDGYTFTCTGSTQRNIGYPLGQMTVSGRLVVTAAP